MTGPDCHELQLKKGREMMLDVVGIPLEMVL